MRHARGEVRVKTPEEIEALATGFASFELAWDAFDWSTWTEGEKHQVLVRTLRLTTYDGIPRAAKRRAAALFRRWLSSDQRSELRRLGYFFFIGSAGGVYRLYPASGRAERVERHGKNWFCIAIYCYHSESEALPTSDTALAHYLFLLTDELGFLASANATIRSPECWNSAYMKRRARIRRIESALPADATDEARCEAIELDIYLTREAEAPEAQ
jgi:hypothetical protein